MKKVSWFFILAVLFLSGCIQTQNKPLSALPSAFPKIDRQPGPANYAYLAINHFPTYNPESNDPFQMDLRSANLSAYDLSKSYHDLLFATFDSKTIWPIPSKMPAGYDYKKIMTLGENPGLNIQQLHEKGITGVGVGIAIIDQPLLVDHVEYANQLRLYEEADDLKNLNISASMHGLAVASIAVGKTVGVAPEADLYFIGTNFCSQGTYETVNFSCLAKSVRRILEINESLPEDRKIRVISISIGWRPDSIGIEDIKAAIQEAKNMGILVVSSSLEETHGFKFHSLGRQPLADPNDFQSYEPGIFWAKNFYEGQHFSDRLLVPMDSRTTASPTGIDDYVFYREGGWSWSIPYIAGVYALAAQAKPNITPDEFWSLAMKTGKMINLNHNGETIPFGPILDPVALINSLGED